MSVQELEQAVSQLSVEELSEFAQWFAEFHHDEWDKQIIADSKAGRLNKLIEKAHQDFEAGRRQVL
jgi:hypothetical protein